jgi:hypothetical protein
MVSFDMINCKIQVKAQLDVLPLPLREGGRGRGPRQHQFGRHTRLSSC